MQTPNDWKNAEMTKCFKVNHFTSSTHNGAAHTRGGRNTNELPKQCEAQIHMKQVESNLKKI